MTRRRSRKIRRNSKRRTSRRHSRRLLSNRKRRTSRRLHSLRRNSRRASRRRASRRLRSNSKRRVSRRRASRRLRSNSKRRVSRRRHSRKLRSNSKRHVSRRRHSRRLSRNVSYALASNRRGSRRRHSRKLRSNSRRSSRRVRRTSRSRGSRSRGLRRNSAALRTQIGRGFAKLRKAPLVGRIKRLYDKPSALMYYGAPSYKKSFGKVKPADAKRYARRLGALVANTLVGGLQSRGSSHRVGHPSQVVETRRGSRMWNASYPITVSAYQTTGYIRDFKFGGIAKRKAYAKKGARLYGTRNFGRAPIKRRHSRKSA